MIGRRHRLSAGLYLASDLVATFASFWLAWFLRFELEIIQVVKGTPELARYVQLLPLILVLWPVVFYFHGLYQKRRGRSLVEEASTCLLAVVLATVLLSVVTAWVRVEESVLPTGQALYFTYSRGFLAVFAIANLATIVTLRYFVRAVLRRVRASGYNVQRILMVGAGALGKEITQKIQVHRELGFEVVGFLDDDPGKIGMSFYGVPVLGNLADIDRVLSQQQLDQVFIALPLEAYKKTLKILRRVGQECIDVKLVPDILQFATLKAAIEDLDGMPVINLSQVPLQGWSTLLKRGMDILIATAAMLLLLPFLPIVAAIIWFEDRGPIFYSQERMGLDGQSFMIWKFRSMRVNAEATTGPVWAVKDDPRRTRFGSFIRRWSIDELPQLWNVLKGDMSVVGPRPERPAFVHEFKHKIPQYMLRHRVKAGITGWAQVHGWRGNTSIKKRLQYDLYYIENWSLKLDIKILWMTLWHGLRHNAY